MYTVYIWFWPTLIICLPRLTLATQLPHAHTHTSIGTTLHTHTTLRITRVGQNHICTVYIYGVYTVLLAGKSPKIRSYTVYLYDSGHPYVSPISPV